GVDVDAAVLGPAGGGLRSHVQVSAGDFGRADLPPCDAIVASFALHHVRTRTAKAGLYRRVAKALRRRGVLVTVDCQPSADRRTASSQRQAWLAHLRRSYTAARAERFLEAWSREDVYVPLEVEL